MKKSRCPMCAHLVLVASMLSYGKIKLCVECYAGVKQDNQRTGKRKRVRQAYRKEPVVMNKYGTAEHVQKEDGKAVISGEKLSSQEVSSAINDSKTAAPSEKSKKKVVVADEDFKQE